MFRLEATWMGQVFYDFSRGIDNRPVISEWERKSVSCEQTFESDINENAAVTIHLYHTVLELARLVREDLYQAACDRVVNLYTILPYIS